MKINYTKLIILNYIFLLILEFIFKFAILKTIDNGILYILIFTLPVAVLLTFITSLFRNTIINRIMSILMWILIYAAFISETVYYSFYKSICGVSAIMYGGQVMEFASSIMVHVKSNIVILGIMLIPLLIMILLSIFKIKHEKFIFKDTFALFFASYFMGITSLELNFNEVSSAKNLYYETNDLIEGTNKFGILNSVTLDAIKVLTGFEESIVLESTLPFTKESGVEYNSLNIDFDNLIENENDATIKSMHQYFKNQNITNKNDHTGIFAGKNLIFITAEGFYPIAVDEFVTPTLYKLVNNGLVFDNYYQPIYNCSTSDGEFINELSILPGVATCSMKETVGVYLPYSLGNIMSNYGYKTNSFHGWTYTYYNRDKTVPNLGYTYYGYDRYHKGYQYALSNIKDSWPTSDIDVMNSSYPIYSNEEHFMTYYMSISGHLEYNFTGGNAMSSKNKDAVSSINGRDSIKAYIASQVEFDRSLEILLNNLENDGILDDTVIVIAADHYPYGLSNEDIASYVDWMKDPNFDLYKNNLIVYNSAIKTEHITKNVSSLDILPTVLNLFGVEYDSRLLMGHDIFSDTDDLVIFNNKSWITSKGRYNYLKKTFVSTTDEELDPNYVNDINEIVKLKFQMSKLLISKDYYRKVGI